MYILGLYQNNYSKDLAAFDSLEEGREFVSKIPGYTIEKEDNIEYEYFNPKTYLIIWRKYRFAEYNLRKTSRFIGL